MLGARLFHRLLGLERTVIEAVEVGEDDTGEYLAVPVRPRQKAALRCGRCGARPPLLSIGEAKWNEVMGVGHLERLRAIRSLLAGSPRYDTSRTTLACYSGAGFTPELVAAAQAGEVVLVGLDRLYGRSA